MANTKLLLAISAISTINAAFFYPNPSASILEHILVDTHGAYKSGFADAITPCSNYVSGAQTFGRTTAAQWLRVAFHDFVTADVALGTGGIDASIGFETLREENSGSAFNDSFSFWREYVNSRVSMADLVAMGTVVSVGNCGGSQIPVRGGRIDAMGGGEEGVPAPETDLETTLAFFSGAGFNQVDSIALTACGHTMGSVHHGGFPTVVGPEAVSPTNTAGGVHFDSTVAIFDPVVVHEYLNGTGNQGGPLVTSFNITSRSDLRLYESDNNATMIKLGALEDGFADACVPLFQRMLETVPKGVVLSPVITPQAIKPINATLDFDAAGHLIFTGYIRTLTPSDTTVPSSETLVLTTSYSSIPINLSAEPTPGTNVFGTTLFYPFSVPILVPETFHSFTISSSSIKPTTFPVQSSIFIVPSLSSITFTASNTIVNFTIAAKPTTHSLLRLTRRTSDPIPPIVDVIAPVPQEGTLGPAMKRVEVVSVVSVGWTAGYALWSGSVVVGEVTGPVSVEARRERLGEVEDLLFLGSE